MDRADAKRLVDGLFGKQQNRDFEMAEPGQILPIREMMEELLKLSDTAAGFYAWSREPLTGKFDDEQKRNYTIKSNQCGVAEAISLKAEYGTSDPDILAAKLGLKVSAPDMPTGGGRVLFAQYTEPDEIVIFMDAVQRAKVLIEQHAMGELLENLDVKKLLLAHEIFHSVESQKEDRIYTRTEKVELWRKPFSNKSGLICLGEIAGMAFARELTGISYSPFIMDVLLMYGYHEAAATALYEEMMEIAAQTAEQEERTDVN